MKAAHEKVKACSQSENTDLMERDNTKTKKHYVESSIGGNQCKK
jgi:hypothetical protein